MGALCLLAWIGVLGSTLAYEDSRNIRNGNVMMASAYTDQPYCAVNPRSSISGNEVWSCVITASMGGEGSAGEQVYSVVSEDRGKTWSAPVTVEAGTATPGGLPNAYANIILADQRHQHAFPLSKRLYAVYNLNLHNVTLSGRKDELGFFYMRYSDNDGQSWSTERYLVPYPNTWVDNQNDFNGTTHIMWTVDQIKRMPGGAVAFAFTKIGKYVQNPPEEIFFMHSPNLLSAANAEDITWELYPAASDHGLKAPAMYNPNTTVMEEGHLLPLAQVSLSPPLLPSPLSAFPSPPLSSLSFHHNATPSLPHHHCHLVPRAVATPWPVPTKDSSPLLGPTTLRPLRDGLQRISHGTGAKY
jgi:hypothetical protein